MEPTTTADDVKKEITFPNGNRATLVEATVGQDPEEILRALGLEQPKALLMIAGGADSLGEDVAVRLRQLFSRGVARAALAAEALIIDGGTQAGVMELMGQGVADRGRKTPLLGVAPTGKVTYPGGPAEGSINGGAALDPNHSHFVLVEGKAWGDETETMFALAKALSARAPDPPKEDGQAATDSNQEDAKASLPVVMVVAGGGNVTPGEALSCVRQGWPLLVIQGSGGFADKIAEEYAKRRAWLQKLAEVNPDPNAEPVPQNPPFIADDALAEIVSDGTLSFFSLLVGTPEALKNELVNLAGRGSARGLLERVWRSFVQLDTGANKHQKRFLNLQFFILAMGIAAVLLALFQTQFYGIEPLAGEPGDALVQQQIEQAREARQESFAYQALHWIIVVVPILISILLTLANQFKLGTKWVLLRASAEAVKREIYRYRTRATVYSDAALVKENETREGMLAQRIKNITGPLMNTAVNETEYEEDADTPPPIPPKYLRDIGDDGFRTLTPEEYIRYRLENQLAYFRDKTREHKRRLTLFQVLIILSGGIGTLLAAIGWELWIALTTAFATAFATYLQYRQTESTLIQYNQTATNLENVHNWWMGLSPSEAANPVNASLLVDNTERILETEQQGWMQQMQDALATLAAQQAKESKKLKDEGIGALLPPDTRELMGDGAPTPEDEEPKAEGDGEPTAEGDVTASPPAGDAEGDVTDEPPAGDEVARPEGDVTDEKPEGA